MLIVLVSIVGLLVIACGIVCTLKKCSLYPLPATPDSEHCPETSFGMLQVARNRLNMIQVTIKNIINDYLTGHLLRRTPMLLTHRVPDLREIDPLTSPRSGQCQWAPTPAEPEPVSRVTPPVSGCQNSLHYRAEHRRRLLHLPTMRYFLQTTCLTPALCEDPLVKVMQHSRTPLCRVTMKMCYNIYS